MAAKDKEIEDLKYRVIEVQQQQLGRTWSGSPTDLKVVVGETDWADPAYSYLDQPNLVH